MKSLRSQSHKHCLITPAAMKQCINASVHRWFELKTPEEPPFTYCCGLVQVIGAAKKNPTNTKKQEVNAQFTLNKEWRGNTFSYAWEKVARLK